MRHHRDITSYTKGKKTIEPLGVYRGHSSIVGVGASISGVRAEVLTLMSTKDVSWHATKENIFASVGDDRQLMM